MITIIKFTKFLNCMCSVLQLGNNLKMGHCFGFSKDTDISKEVLNKHQKLMGKACGYDRTAKRMH